MYHLTQMWLAIVALSSVSFYALGRVHGRRALHRQLRGDAS